MIGPLAGVVATAMSASPALTVTISDGPSGTVPATDATFVFAASEPAALREPADHRSGRDRPRSRTTR